VSGRRPAVAVNEGDEQVNVGIQGAPTLSISELIAYVEAGA
jgi:hypothetical protein